MENQEIDISFNIPESTDISSTKINNISCLCFSGGGATGLSFISSLELLINMNIISLENINLFVGTSAGSIFAFLLNIGVTIEEIKEFVYAFDFKFLIGEIDCITLLEDFGINDGTRMIIKIYVEFLKRKYKKSDVTFGELYNMTHKKLIIIGTNLSEYIETVFSVDTTPNFSVIQALRISTSIPVIFTPVIINNIIYVDGALTNNFPINYCPINNTFGFYIINNPIKINTFQNLVMSCLSTTINAITNKNLNDNLYKNIIKINNPSNEVTSFIIDKELIDNIFQLGIDATKLFLNNH
jgi:predicted patatin/cPLA2 family phospholipase